MNTQQRAVMFAREAHKDQVRKYTGNPYTGQIGIEHELGLTP